MVADELELLERKTTFALAHGRIKREKEQKKDRYKIEINNRKNRRISTLHTLQVLKLN